MTARAMTMAAAGNSAEPLYVDDVFSTYLYTGNTFSRDIINGIDLLNNGGLVWTKNRGGTTAHTLLDSVRSTFDSALETSGTGAQAAVSYINPASNGYALTGSSMNSSGNIYASWTFRKAPKFFTLGTITHTSGTANNIDLSELGTVGMVIVKATNTTGSWFVWHRGQTAGRLTYLNLINGQAIDTAISVSGTTLTIPSATPTMNMVYYAWAHDTANTSFVQCDVYAGNAGVNNINLGWEAQFLLIKNITSSADWKIVDSMRGLTANGTFDLLPNSTSAETSSGTTIRGTASGFEVNGTGPTLNASGSSYIYLAVRRPNKPPTTGTQVFMPTLYTGTNTDNVLLNTTIAPDVVWLRQRTGSGLGHDGFLVGNRARGQGYLKTGTTNAETVAADGLDQQVISTVEYGSAFSSMNGVWVGNNGTSTGANINVSTTANDHIALAFKRAPGFFDVVTYTGTGANATIKHALGGIPELMIIKGASGSGDWYTWHINLTAAQHLLMTSSAFVVSDTTVFNNTYPTATTFFVGTNNNVNKSDSSYIAYLFASLPGICKVGTYTGNGASQAINCGFSAGSRFVLIKASSGAGISGDWMVFDSARGISSGSDPYLKLNGNAPEVSVDMIGTGGAGFNVTHNQATDSINASGRVYMYLAIA